MTLDHPRGGPRPTDALAGAQAPVRAAALAGELDDTAAARLLRWCESQLHLVDLGRGPIRHILIDMSHACRARPTALAILAHARAEAERRHVEIYLVGAGAIMDTATLPVRQHLNSWNTFPTLEAARAVLTPSSSETDGSTRRPVDPDAIMLTPISPVPIG
jgi:ABC-type transporter Mla MlaB component